MPPTALSNSGFQRLLRFLLAGLPAFLIAIPLNWWLVEHVGWAKPLAYALVLVVQVTINFFACIAFVFRRDQGQRLSRQFLLFMGGILLARLLDWGLYRVLVESVPVHYLLVQVFNVALFSIAKFLMARRVLEGADAR